MSKPPFQMRNRWLQDPAVHIWIAIVVIGLVAAIAGTTCSAAVFIMRSTVVAEKGWTTDHLKNERRDAFVSVFMMFFLSGIIMAVAAGTRFEAMWKARRSATE